MLGPLEISLWQDFATILLLILKMSCCACELRATCLMAQRDHSMVESKGRGLCKRHRHDDN